ncbi:chorismate mutase [Kineococcus radiotolerans SRS30216 = ATCC BAA-149]|uniref:chorismate mutase n=1 Tax=Kineococcus radiotolerans (strain ATCC BAA-149 / DSM 14245 / SRS30216) TaxID=266940 RepID=A6WCP4_KINRD|nr:chorismate mutase [Kineococcus radiotolerans SRS30216 = ATCC BAA-149]
MGTLPRVSVRAVRGAVQVDVDEREEVLARTRDLVSEVIRANDLSLDDFISVIFTSTADLVSEFPAVAARELGMGDVPLMCARELEIAGSMPRVIRLMAHVETPRARSEVKHVYLNGAQALRRDIAQ